MDEGGDREPPEGGSAQLFGEDERSQRAEPDPPILFGNPEPEEADLAHLQQDVAWYPACRLPPFGYGDDLVFHIPAGLCPHRGQVVGLVDQFHGFMVEVGACQPLTTPTGRSRATGRARPASRQVSTTASTSL